jgi:hypothetical protein
LVWVEDEADVVNPAKVGGDEGGDGFCPGEKGQVVFNDGTTLDLLPEETAALQPMNEQVRQTNRRT